MKGGPPRAVLLSAALWTWLAWSGGAFAQTGTAARAPECVAANDEVTRLRLGHDRAGRAAPVNPGQAVAAGRRAAGRCSGDNAFLIAYALARIDLSKDIKGVSLDNRTSYFNGALADLELVKRRVEARQGAQYEIFNILGLTYYDTRQYEKSIAVLNEAGPFLNASTTVSRRNTYFTKGMAQYQLGRTAEAASSFGTASKFGHPQAARWEATLRRKK